ncbi:MAG: tetratricopeptide repeat protein [Candidatus Yanofskybacteria bacterium]|nr:tetratricopeptide repeat protein [Candidatus Yanofskybacteria bacterium]
MNKPKQFLPILILVGVAFAIYAFNLNGQLFWDDDDWIKGNIFVHDFSHLKEIFTQNILSGFGLNSNYYRPLLLLSFAVNYAIGGIKPLVYHLVSNGFHLANGVLVFSILYLVFRRRLPAFLAALFFLIHPLQTEAVTYVSGRGDPMSVFFMLLAIWFFIKTESCTTSQVVQGDKWWIRLMHDLRCRAIWRFFSLFSLILAILSRETAVLLPPLLMIFYISFLAPLEVGRVIRPQVLMGLSSEGFWKSFRAALLKTSYFWVISAGYFVLRLTVLNFKNTLNFYSQASDYSQHLSYRLFTFGHVFVEYFKLIFVPVGLHMERDLPLKTSLFQWPVWLAVIIVVLIVWVGIVLYKKGRVFKLTTSDVVVTSDVRIWFFGWGWFFIGLAPVSGIIPINAIMYEHWLYLPLIGLFTLAGFYLAKLFDFLKSRPKITDYRLPIASYHLLITALVVYFSFFGYQSIKRNILWGKPIEFYENILKYNSNSVRIMNNLGNLYSEKGEIGKAEELYVKAIGNPNGNIFAQPHYNLGNIYRDRGDAEKAVMQYKEAIKADPTFPFAYQNLAVIYAGRGNLTEAALMLEKVKELKPQDSRVYYNLGLIYLAQNKKDLALENLKAAFRFSAGDPEVAVEIRRILEELQ